MQQRKDYQIFRECYSLGAMQLMSVMSFDTYREAKDWIDYNIAKKDQSQYSIWHLEEHNNLPDKEPIGTVPDDIVSQDEYKKWKKSSNKIR